MDIKWLPFQKRINTTGALTFLEAERDVPFPIRRVYYIFDVEPGARRGYHAHKSLEQALICVHGSCKILLDDGLEKNTVTLSDPSIGLYVGYAIWREMFDFSPDAVLLVLASDYFEESDYIRDYEEYLKFLEQGGECQ